MAGFIYRFFYKGLKEWLWRNYLLKLHSKRTDYIIQKFPIIKTRGKMLGIGISKGKLEKAISKKLALSFIGTDINSKRKKYEFPFVRCSGYCLPFKSNTLSLITAFSVIEHILEEKRDSFYNEIFLVLKEDGYLVIQHPNRYFPIEQHSFIPFVGYLPSRFHGLFFHEYCRVPSKNSLINSLEKKGFILEQALSYGLPPSFSYAVHLLEMLKFFKIFPFGYLLVFRKRSGL